MIQGTLRSQEDVDDLFETRLILETELVALCAQRASDTDLQKIESLVLQMEDASEDRTEQMARLDIQFHLAIADAAKNRLLSRLFYGIHGLIEEMLTKRESILGGHEGTCLGHQTVLQALKQRAPQAARVAMREHLDGFSARYLREHLAESRSKDEVGNSKRGSRRELHQPSPQ
jgi:GntR family transcriptional repressor for pyruvate dehydrogenase complex